jgi:hypothetical protein
VHQFFIFDWISLIFWSIGVKGDVVTHTVYKSEQNKKTKELLNYVLNEMFWQNQS